MELDRLRPRVWTALEFRSNGDLARALGRSLHRPFFIPAPGFMVRLILGEFGSVILKGQRVIPRRLLDHGFVFQYPDIDKALQSLIGG